MNVVVMATTVGAAIGWRLRAACRAHDPELFFPLHTARGSQAHRAEPGKRICARCPVARDCLSWALRHAEDHGIWGGLTRHERRGLLSGHIDGYQLHRRWD